jgi:serine/threonine protein phosphatase PrpC/tRNA A-37 threonylcarbamoyl transferase component Bud32
MTESLTVKIGQYSHKGRKAINQDAINAFIPETPELNAKGIAVALADGISSSNVSQDASNAVVMGFIEDYYSTSEAWSVETAGKRVITALNSWLCAQTKRSEYRYNIDKGYVCTFSGLVLKGQQAHLFHVGDSRIVRVRNRQCEVLTQEHRTHLSSQESYLARAMGMKPELDIDYLETPLEKGDIFVLMTDGVYEYISDKNLIELLNHCSENINQAAKAIVDLAFDNLSHDNLSVQVVYVNAIKKMRAADLHSSLLSLPFPPQLEARIEFDGFLIERRLYDSTRSSVFIASDLNSGEKVVIKTLSTELQNDETHRERFLLEEWIARRVNSAHLLKPTQSSRKRNYFYVVTEYIEGQTLSQWMLDNPKPKLEVVRNIVEQIAKGLRALHKKEMLHQDLRPENIMIDHSGTIKIIDFGAVRVAGIDEMIDDDFYDNILGTALYSAPEYFLGEAGVNASDQFSLAVITYHMLSGKFPYGTQVAKANTRAAQKRLQYNSVLDDELAIPAWVDFALKKALHPNPFKRYDDLSEFIFDLRQPSQTFLQQTRAPIMARNPLAFWQSLCAILTLTVVILLSQLL